MLLKTLCSRNVEYFEYYIYIYGGPKIKHWLRYMGWHKGSIKMPMVYYHKNNSILQGIIQTHAHKKTLRKRNYWLALKMLNNVIRQKLTTSYHNGYPFLSSSCVYYTQRLYHTRSISNSNFLPSSHLLIIKLPAQV